MGRVYSCVIILLLSVLGSSLQAQTDELKVDDFYNDPTYAIKARTETVEDGNKKPCGLVILRIAVPDVIIEGSYIVKKEERGNEWYIWMAEDASYIIISSSDHKYRPLEYHFPEPIKSKSAYVMIVKKPDTFIYVQFPEERKKERYYNGNNTLAFFESAILPGLGQWCKGYAGHGIANMLGEAALIGGTVYFYNNAQKYNAEISNGGTVNTETVNLYNSSVTTYRVLLGAAITLYVFNLFQAVIIEPNSNYFDNVYLSPTLMPIDNTFVPGIGLTLNL